jgi:hypothetical protein
LFGASGVGRPARTLLSGVIAKDAYRVRNCCVSAAENSPARTLAVILGCTLGIERRVDALGHTKLESTVRYLGIEVDDALEIAEQTEA